MITTKTARFTFHSSKIGDKLISMIFDAEIKRSRGGFIHSLQNFNAVVTDMFNQGLITLDTALAAASAAKAEDDGTRFNTIDCRAGDAEDDRTRKHLLKSCG